MPFTESFALDWPGLPQALEDATRVIEAALDQHARAEMVRLERDASLLIGNGWRLSELTILKRDGYPSQVVPSSHVEGYCRMIRRGFIDPGGYLSALGQDWITEQYDRMLGPVTLDPQATDSPHVVTAGTAAPAPSPGPAP